MIQNFSHIGRVPQSTELIDVALSKTNRKTPTIVRAKYEIHRIRHFYVRKVKHTAGEFNERLDEIIKEFPVLEDIHPFYSDLIGILYDRDHYKISLGQVNMIKHKIEALAKEHVRMLNFGDSLYRCKQLKRAALGHMATMVKKLTEPLKYLEEVRQHLSRLPAIDTSGRTLIICGFPNVGKSSFMNSITNAHVEVESYAFTTRSIFVGHFDYKNLRWQAIDTPGILDKPLSDRNSIEMQTIAALAHLKSAVLFFMDLSETCGHSIAEQITLYESLVPLLTLQVLIVFSKADLVRLVDCQDQNLINFLNGKKYVEVSVQGNFGVEEARNMVCDALLAERALEKSNRIDNFIHRIRPIIPVQFNEKSSEVYLGKHPLQGQHECEGYQTEYKYDIIPEFYNGKNISDMIDSGILTKVAAVEEQVKQDKLREYDILGKEERAMYEACNNARIEATMRAQAARRMSMPQSWKNKITTKGELVSQIRTAVPIVKAEPVHQNKRAARDNVKAYHDMKPKHIFRPRGNKFAN